MYFLKLNIHNNHIYLTDSILWVTCVSEYTGRSLRLNRLSSYKVDRLYAKHNVRLVFQLDVLSMKYDN